MPKAVLSLSPTAEPTCEGELPRPHGNTKHGLRAKRPIIRCLLPDDEAGFWDRASVPFARPDAVAETIDHVAILRDFALPLAPDYVLLQWFVNDVEGHDKSGRPTFYRLVPSDFLTGYLHRHSVLYYLINDKWKTLQVKLGLVDTYEAYMVRRFRDPNSESSRAANDALEEFLHESTAAGIRVGVVAFPQLAETEGLVENYPLGFLMDRVLETCREQQIICLDLRPVFAPVSPASKLWANRLDGHPGRLANEMAAEAILRTFATEWLVQQR